MDICLIKKKERKNVVGKYGVVGMFYFLFFLF